LGYHPNVEIAGEREEEKNGEGKKEF